jgi:3-deoxy-D-manno-octulosonate 8-phosphate phosphatase (KDO 8-P phosphatase)
MSPDFIARARRIQLVGFDVDGVLTDGRLHYGDAGESKAFHARDGMGIKLLQLAGIRVAIVSARGGEAVLRRCRELGIDDVALSAHRKWPAFSAVLERYGLDANQAAFMGDDVPDLPILRRVALAATVGEASAAIAADCHFVASRPAGMGAAREFIDALLAARDALAQAIDKAIE